MNIPSNTVLCSMAVLADMRQAQEHPITETQQQSLQGAKNTGVSRAIPDDTFHGYGGLKGTSFEGTP